MNAIKRVEELLERTWKRQLEQHARVDGGDVPRRALLATIREIVSGAPAHLRPTWTTVEALARRTPPLRVGPTAAGACAPLVAAMCAAKRRILLRSPDLSPELLEFLRGADDDELARIPLGGDALELLEGDDDALARLH